MKLTRLVAPEMSLLEALSRCFTHKDRKKPVLFELEFNDPAITRTIMFGKQWSKALKQWLYVIRETNGPYLSYCEELFVGALANISGTGLSFGQAGYRVYDVTDLHGNTDDFTVLREFLWRLTISGEIETNVFVYIRDCLFSEFNDWIHTSLPALLEKHDHCGYFDITDFVKQYVPRKYWVQVCFVENGSADIKQTTAIIPEPVYAQINNYLRTGYCDFHSLWNSMDDIHDKLLPDIECIRELILLDWT